MPGGPSSDAAPNVGLEVTALDPDDPDDLAAWHAVYYAAVTHDREYATPWMLEEVRAALHADGPGMRTTAWTGTVAGRVVTTGRVDLPMQDNLTQAWLDVKTSPDQQGRGYGSAMLEHLVRRAAQEDRSVLVAEASYPYDGPSDGAGTIAVDFLRRRGFSLGLADVQRILDLPVEDSLLQSLAEEAAGHHRGYEIREFSGPVPTDLLESYGRLVGSLVVEMPTGDFDLEPQLYDEARIRAEEKVLAEAGRLRFTTLAVAPDGTAAAYSDLLVPGHDPGRAYIGGTLVAPGHRGHRLGLATKVHNLRLLQRECPGVQRVVTFNAEDNQHMVAVNDRLGYRPVERLAQFQRRLSPG